MDDLELWSIADLMAVKKGSFKQYVARFIKLCDEHVMQCEVRTARIIIAGQSVNMITFAALPGSGIPLRDLPQQQDPVPLELTNYPMLRMWFVYPRRMLGRRLCQMLKDSPSKVIYHTPTHFIKLLHILLST